MNQMLSDLEALYQTLEDNHEDWLTYSILADWYEEHEESDKSEAIRWQVANKKRARGIRSTLPRSTAWYDALQVTGAVDPESDLPTPVFSLLTGVNSSSFRRDYPTVEEAQKDFIQAWIKAYKSSPRRPLQNERKVPLVCSSSTKGQPSRIAKQVPRS